MKKYHCNLFLIEFSHTGLINYQTAHIYINGKHFVDAHYGEAFLFESSNQFELAVSFSNMNGVSKRFINDTWNGFNFQPKVVKTLFKKYLDDGLMIATVELKKMSQDTYVSLVDLDERPYKLERMRIFEYFSNLDVEKYKGRKSIHEVITKVTNSYKQIVDIIDLNSNIDLAQFKQIVNISFEKYIENGRLSQKTIDEMSKEFSNKSITVSTGYDFKTEKSEKKTFNLNFGPGLINALCSIVIIAAIPQITFAIQDSNREYAKKGIHVDRDLYWESKTLNELFDWKELIKQDIEAKLVSSLVEDDLNEDEEDDYIKECIRFADNAYDLLNNYPCFDRSRIKDFALMHCLATTEVLFGYLGKDVPNEYVDFISDEVGAASCMKYLNAYQHLLINPSEIDFQWIPKDCPFDVDEYLDEIGENPVNISELIYISFCFNPGLLLLSDYTIGLPKKIDALTERCCVEFMTEKMMSLLDAFDEFNTYLLEISGLRD